MYRNPDWILSSVDDFVMQILGMSQAMYGDGWIVGKAAYERLRPDGWPKLYTVLAYYGFEQSRGGWERFVDHNIGLPVIEVDAFNGYTDKRQWCKNCGRMENWRSGLCEACYHYWLRHRMKRPRHLWDDEMGCKNCGVPLKSQGLFKGGERRQRKGYCIPCAAYKLRTGKHRPKHLWGDGPHGWCECGYPAVALVEDMPVCVRHRE